MKHALVAIAVLLPLALLTSCHTSGWGRRVGGDLNEFANDVEVDHAGNVYVVGYGESGFDFGDGQTTSFGGEDIFIVKYSEEGTVLWTRNIGGTGDERVHSAALDREGNCFVGGYTTSPFIVFGGETLKIAPPGGQILVMKMSPDGAPVWVANPGPEPVGEIYSVAVDDSGNCYAAGRFAGGRVIIGGDTLVNTGRDTLGSRYAGERDFYLIKFNAEGAVSWVRAGGGAGDDIPSAIAVDDSGNCYLTGWFYSPTFDYGGGHLSNAGGSDAFIIKYDPNGLVTWARREGGSGRDEFGGIALNDSAGIYLVGYFGSPTLELGSDVLRSRGGLDMFVARYSPGGSVRWAVSAGGDSLEIPNGIAVDREGNCLVTGWSFSPQFIAGEDTLDNPGESGTILLKLNSEGSPIGLWALGGDVRDKDAAVSVAVDGSSAVYVVGGFGCPVFYYPGGELHNTGSHDAFLVKIVERAPGATARGRGFSLYIPRR